MLSRFEALRSGATPLVGRDEEGTPASFRLLQRLIDYGIFLRPHLDGGVEGPSHPGQCDQPPASVFIRSHWWCPTSHRWYPDVFACAVPWSR